MQNKQFLRFFGELSSNFFLAHDIIATSEFFLHYSFPYMNLFYLGIDKYYVPQEWYHVKLLIHHSVLLTLVCSQMFLFCCKLIVFVFFQGHCIQAFLKFAAANTFACDLDELNTKRESVEKLSKLSFRISFTIGFCRHLCPQRLSWNCTLRCKQNSFKVVVPRL